VRWGTISAQDLQLMRVASTPEEAFDYLRGELTRLYLEPDSDRVRT
jgi:hypothetical protein